jgi:NaMN:DMB phosphoribosyltransferase
MLGGAAAGVPIVLDGLIVGAAALLAVAEGSGAAIAIHLIRLACRLPREMATFDEAGVSRKAGTSRHSMPSLQ